jgi:transcriptional regulator with XRE-family HTH domain
LNAKAESEIEIARRIAVNLAYVMKMQGMSQAELARASGVLEMTVSHVIRAKHCGTVCTVARLAEALGVSVDRLLRPSLTGRAPRSRRAARAS